MASNTMYTKRTRTAREDEANFLVEAARIKLTEISAQLAREEKQIKSKKSIAELFVHLLAEWLNKDDRTSSATSPVVGGAPITQEKLASLVQRKNDFVASLFSRATSEASLPSFDRHFVSEMFGGEAFHRLRATTERFCINTVHDNITVAEVRAGARALLASRELAQADENMLGRVTEESDKLASEYACLLSILLKNLDDWKWKEDQPLEGRVLYCRVPDKFRLIATGDTVTALFLEVLGRRWSEHLRQSMPDWQEGLNWSAKEEEAFGTNFENTDSFIDDFWHAESADLFLASLPARSEEGAEDNPTYQTEHLEHLIMIVAAVLKFDEVLPSKTDALGLIQSDIKDFGMSLQHDLVLAVLECIGVTPKWLAFFGKYIKDWCVDVEGRQYRPVDGRGLLLAHTLSHVCTELVLCLLDLSMAKAGHPLLRAHDDFIFCARGEPAANNALSHCIDTVHKLGLEHNESKTAAVFLSGEEEALAEESSDLRAAMTKDFKLRGLVLNGGGWKIQEKHVGRLLEPLQLQGTSVFALLNQYNSQLRTIRSELGPVCRALGADHARAVIATMKQAEQHLCGGETNDWEDVESSLLHSSGMADPPFVAFLARELSQRFPVECSDANVLQPGWFFWPVAAGGLYAEHASLRAESVARALKNSRDPAARLEDTRRAPPRKWAQWIEWQNKFPHLSTSQLRAKVSSAVVSRPPGTLGTSDIEEESCPFATVDEFNECDSYSDYLRSWARDVTRALEGLASKDGVCKEAPPVVEDKQLRQLIAAFTARTEEFGDFGGHTTAGLGAYMKCLVARYGNDLQSTFGTLGLIPADLAPHSLLETIRSERRSKELPDE